jgi:acyl-homoserine-lactone acylase
MDGHQATDAQRLAALDEAVARLKADFGDWRVPWGQINRYQRNDGAITQHFDDAKPSTPCPSRPRNGVRWRPMAASAIRAPNAITARWATASWRRWNSAEAARARCRSAGKAGSGLAPFRRSGGRYMQGDLREVWFYPEDLAGHTESTKVLVRR